MRAYVIVTSAGNHSLAEKVMLDMVKIWHNVDAVKYIWNLTNQYLDVLVASIKLQEDQEVRDMWNRKLWRRSDTNV